MLCAQSQSHPLFIENNSATQIDEVFDFLEDHDNVKQCYNIEGVHQFFCQDDVDLNPQIEFEKNHPTFDKLMVNIQLGSLPTKCIRVGKIIIHLLINEIE